MSLWDVSGEREQVLTVRNQTNKQKLIMWLKKGGGYFLDGLKGVPALIWLTSFRTKKSCEDSSTSPIELISKHILQAFILTKFFLTDFLLHSQTGDFFS